MSSNKDFPYLPLTAPTQTRIVLLAPGKSDDPIHCFQRIINLDHDWTSPDGDCQLRPCSAGQPTSSQETSLQYEESGSCFMIPGLQNAFKGYTALSYVWGDQSNLHEIFIDGRPFYVGENLYIALLRLRRPVVMVGLGGTALEDFRDRNLDAIEHHMSSEGRFLWVDAICINQNDVAERETQVKLMARIYQQADHVHGDLGRKDMTGGYELLHLLQRIMRAGSRCRSQSSPPEENSDSDANIDIESAFASEFENFTAGKTGNTREVRLPSPSAKILEEQGIPREHDDLWAHWRQFLNSAYFQRLWILQEASLAKSITLWYSDVSIELEMVAECLQCLTMYSTNSTFYSLSSDECGSARGKLPNIWAVIGLILQRRQMHGVDGHLIKQVSLLHMLDLARRTKATDLRDKIFGLLGMAADGSDFLHLVTYSRSVEEVYQDFAKFFIERGQGITMLYQVDSRVSKTLDIPSWVPDWSRERGEMSLYDTMPAISGALDEQNALDIRHYGSKLALKGHIVDTVERLSTPMPSNLTYGELSEVTRFLWEGCNLLVNQNIEGYKTVEIMLQTLTCGSLNAKSAAEVESLRQSLTAVFGHATFMANGGESENSPWIPHMRHFMVIGMAFAPGRRWCITKTGQFGLVPEGTKKGDHVALFGNYSLPFLLRDQLPQGSASGQGVDEPVHRSVTDNLSSKPKIIEAPEASANTDSVYTLVGHGYIYELNMTKIQKFTNRDAQEIVLV